MVDYTMCKGGECPVKAFCYRHVATQGMRQSWFVEVPYNKEKDSCDYFIKATEEKRNKDVQQLRDGADG